MKLWTTTVKLTIYATFQIVVAILYHCLLKNSKDYLKGCRKFVNFTVVVNNFVEVTYLLVTVYSGLQLSGNIWSAERQQCEPISKLNSNCPAI